LAGAASNASIALRSVMTFAGDGQPAIYAWRTEASKAYDDATAIWPADGC